MRAESATIQARVPLQHQEYGSTIRQGALKRKHPSDEVASRKLGEISYPSPPMSSPPSPSGTQFQLPVSGSRDPVQVRTSREGPITSLGSVLAASLPSAQGPAPPALFPQSSVFPGFITAPLSIHSIEPLQSATHPFDPVGQPSQCVQSGRPRLDANVTTTQPASCTPAVDTPSSARRGRKAKAHVASACVNCKRAHLSCDVQRPCARCVATGKQDTCFDVQHKKRGRPRLREEGESRAEPAASEAASQASLPKGPSQTPTRPIASTKHRRTDSYRSLRSQTSDDSPLWSGSTTSYPPSAILQSPFNYQQPHAPNSGRPPYEVPTALLDLDFFILRANRPFEQIVMGGQSLRGRHIVDVAGPAHSESFQNVRTRLRGEREAREPAYMPPILQPGQDALQGISELDVDGFTEGFSDETYAWTQTQLGSAAQTFPARVRLAKAGIFFVVVTLPTFRPVEQPPSMPRYGAPLAVGLPLRAPESYPPGLREAASQSAPPMPNMPFHGAAAGLAQPPPAPIQHLPPYTYPPPQPSKSWQPQQQQQQKQPSYPPQYFPPAPTPSRLPIAEPPTDTAAFTPRPAPRDVTRPRAATSERLLPPIVESPTAGAATNRSRATTMDSIIQQASGDEEDGEGSPRKRRRMGIDDVLQR